MSIITFLIIIAVLIFVHELGHFLAAKKSGIRVDEFALGFPPKIFSWQKGETRYVLNLIPFGGYVKIFGENVDAESLAGPDSSRSFINKKRHIQAMVLVAGIVFNVLFAWILFSLSFSMGIVTAGAGPDAKTIITDVIANSPAEKAGLKAGDILVSFSSVSNESKEIKTPDDAKNLITASEGKEFSLSYKRGDENISKNITANKNIEADAYTIGIQMAQVETVRLPFYKAIGKGAETTVFVFKETAVGIWNFLKQIFTHKADFSQVAGPVGIVSLVGEARHFGLGYLLSFTALISINLAVINLIPFPALDGGRLLVVGIEAIRRKRISAKFVNILNLLGFGLLILFMITVTISDVSKLFH